MKPLTPQNNLWWKRVGWLALIWTVSVALLGLVAYLLRLFMNAAGLTA